MKEIKFRVYMDEKFRYWGFLDDGHGLHFVSPPTTSSVGWNFKKIQEASEQFTGLKGKNGVEIYDGDVVKEGDYVGGIRFVNGSFVVFFVNTPGGWNPEYCPIYSGLSNYEVIGNIHDNPELLEAKP